MTNMPKDTSILVKLSDLAPPPRADMNIYTLDLMFKFIFILYIPITKNPNRFYDLFIGFLFFDLI